MMMTILQMINANVDGCDDDYDDDVDHGDV
jgi:hypothetical protein